ncbi:hypothetical protein ASPBRDRAFT_638658 [Aspergillus brasiliensis CBS 101740]|uniref:Uncharacterized protein n=1 Tax=Aspergillus brasiliensis (strain CBS 101740 / IMI 381727 / IBT 21946) TaxID=767769 RepID=A0A1L9UGI3_ASPBC|nr:hypothetical protein ASPBRDRAFT_638658 [Aspergillus brasiliensis CBS 101740]
MCCTTAESRLKARVKPSFSFFFPGVERLVTHVTASILHKLHTYGVLLLLEGSCPNLIFLYLGYGMITSSWDWLICFFYDI